MEASQALGWVTSCFVWIAALALVGVAAVKVRKVSGAAAALLAGAAVLTLLRSCGFRALWVASSRVDALMDRSESSFAIEMAIGTLVGALTTVLLLVGFAVLARAGRNGSAS